MKKEVVMTQRDHAALLTVIVPLWETERELQDHRSWNTPALTKMYQRNLSSAWRLYSCATFLRAQSNLPGQNSRSELSYFPPQNVHSEHVNESTQSLLLLVRKQEMQSLHKNTSVQNSPPHLVEVAAVYSGKGRLLCLWCIMSSYHELQWADQQEEADKNWTLSSGTISFQTQGMSHRFTANTGLLHGLFVMDLYFHLHCIENGFRYLRSSNTTLSILCYK